MARFLNFVSLPILSSICVLCLFQLDSNVVSADQLGEDVENQADNYGTRNVERGILPHEYDEQLNPWHGSGFPDTPIQLVKPDPATHKRLIMVEENVKLLHRIVQPVVTIAVVGKFHSGKSFLMNQLMGKSKGFGIGPFVRPETMGIWMWGKPMNMQLPSGLDVSVVFLDTEGFAANNVTENYDAKIFAVSTLLSSYLIYNSVKIIDQSDIDYLELLARRTQLFALRSQMSKAKWTDDFNHDLLSFPPLIWVVQDFVQMTVGGETPTEWLHRLMKTHTRENDDYDISLLSIFKQVDCHTLFLPAVTKDLLTDLSKASEQDLTVDYKNERDHLIQKLRSGILPKEKNDQPITGPELASLMTILVDAANDGSLAQVPSRWNVFLERLEATATEDCLRFYEAELAAQLTKRNNEPVNAATLMIWHDAVKLKSFKLLDQLLLGLGNAMEEAAETLSRDIASKYHWINEMNEKKIKLKMSETHHRIELEVENKLGELTLPVKTSELEAVMLQVLADAERTYGLIIADLINAETLIQHQTQLKGSVQRLCDSVVLKNSKALEGVMNTAIQKAVEKFRGHSKNSNDTPRSPAMIQHLIENAVAHATKVFDAESVIAIEELSYTAFASLLRSRLTEEEKFLHKQNAELVKNLAQSQVKTLLARLRDQTSPVHMPLPKNESELTSKLNVEMERCQLLFAEALGDFTELPLYVEHVQLLKKDMLVLAQLRKQENVEAYTREVEVPLRMAKQVIQISEEKYSTIFALTQFMRRICLLNLNEGKPKEWPADLKYDIINHFIETDSNLQKIIQSRKGFWSTIVGFFQWLLWLVGVQ